MKDYVFCIPSYRRADNQACLQYLSNLGFGQDMINISTQDKADYAKYKCLYGRKARIVYRDGTCIADNRNTLLDMFGNDTRVIMLADAIKGFYRISNGKLQPLDSRKAIESMIERGYTISTAENAIMWGVYPIKNDFFMDETYVVNNLIIGCFMAFEKAPEYRFAREYRLKEDFELSLRMVEDGHNIVRFNDTTIDRRHKIKGGCQKMWQAAGDSVNAGACRMLLERYPELVKPHATRQNELRYVGEKKVKPLGSNQR